MYGHRMKAVLLLTCCTLSLAGCYVTLEAKKPDGSRPSSRVMAECSRQAVRANQEAGDYVNEGFHKPMRPPSARKRRAVVRRQTKRWYDLVALCLTGKGYTVDVRCWDCD